MALPRYWIQKVSKPSNLFFFLKKSMETYLLQFSDAEPPINSKTTINKLSNLTFVGDEVLQI